MKQISVEEAIQSTRQAWKELGKSPEEINQGWCREFAHQVVRYCEAKVICASDVTDEPRYQGHTWVFSEGRHFDAECPGGVEDWRRLPLMQRREQ